MGTNVRQNIVTNGLVLYLDAGNRISYTSGSATWIDLSGNGSNGTLTNGPTFDPTNQGSIVFDGTNDFVTGSISTLSTWSVSIWYLSTDITSKAVFYPFSGTTTATGLGFGGTNDANTQNRWYFYDGAGVRSNANMAVVINKWYNLVVTKTSTSYTFYTNGIRSYSVTGVDVNFTKYTLGARGDNQWYVKGNIANASLYNRILSAAEVAQNYNATKTRFGLT